MRLVWAAALVVASVLAGAGPASASTLRALPATIRVNITGLGTSYAVISSTGTISAIAPDGSLLYRGGGKTLARTNVRKVASLGVDLPPRAAAGPLSPAERADRASLLREARLAIAEIVPVDEITAYETPRPLMFTRMVAGSAGNVDADAGPAPASTLATTSAAAQTSLM